MAVSMSAENASQAFAKVSVRTPDEATVNVGPGARGAFVGVKRRTVESPGSLSGSMWGVPGIAAPPVPVTVIEDGMAAAAIGVLNVTKKKLTLPSMSWSAETSRVLHVSVCQVTAGLGVTTPFPSLSFMLSERL